MLNYLFVIYDGEGEPFEKAELPRADRLYTAPGTAYAELASRLYPGIKAVSMAELGRSTPGTLAAFDALIGNFRVLYQDADRVFRAAFVLPPETALMILEERMPGGAEAAGVQPVSGRIIAARGQGGYLIAE